MTKTTEESMALKNQYPALWEIFEQKKSIKTPQGNAFVESFSTKSIKIGDEFYREVQAKVVLDERIQNHFSVFRSKNNQDYYFGFILILNEQCGIWRVADQNYTKEGFEKEFEQVIIE